MAAPELLCLRFKNGTVEAGTLSAGITFNAIGNSFGTAESAPQQHHSYNRVIQFKDGLYVYQNDDIRLYDGSADWDIVHTVTDQSTTADSAEHSGLYIVQVNNVPRLIALYRNTSNILAAVWSDDGSTWTEGVPFGAANASQTALVYKLGNRLMVWNGTGETSLFLYSPSSDSAGGFGSGFLPTALGSGSLTPGHFCEWQGRLFCLALDGNTGGADANLWENVGGVWSKAVDLRVEHGLDNGSSNELFSKFCLFSDGTDMYGFVCAEDGDGVQGSHCIRFQDGGGGSVTSTSVTDPVIPAGLRGQTGGPDVETHNWYVIVDIDTDPANPAVYLWLLDNSASGVFNYFEWNGPGSELTPGTAGPAFGLAIPHFNDGGSEYIYPSSDLNIEIVDNSAVDGGGILLSFRAHGDVGSADKTVSFRYGLASATAATPTTLCTLTGTATGGSASRSGNTVTSVEADDGTTLYTVQWDSVTDGVPVGASVRIHPIIA